MNLKYLVSAAVCAGLVAQQQQPEVKIPREPSTGVMEKAPAPALPPKAAVQQQQPTSTDQASPRRALTPAEKDVADAGARSLAAAFQDRTLVMFDQPQAGAALWARGFNYKASFDSNGWDFIARPSAGAAEPIHFHLAGAQVGTKAIEIGNVMPMRNAHRVEYQHGGVVEAIDVSGLSVEQTFTFATLPMRGDLTVDLEVGTTLASQNSASGVSFTGDSTGVTYSQAIAIDASGQRLAAETSMANGHLTIRVPASFVQNAQLPLVIDPLVTSVTVTSGTSDVSNPDVAYDASSNTWAVCYQQFYAVNDTDCYVQRLDANLGLLGGAVTIDFTSNVWQRPRIANLRAYGKYLVVAQVSTDDPAPFWISARSMNNAGVTGAQFDIQNNAPGTDNINPDVGGDPGGAPTYFTVVWEYNYSATDHDIYARQVDSLDALRGTGPIYIQTNTTNQSHPSISKSDGQGPPYATQRFTIIYQQTFSSSDEDIYGAQLTWDGVIVTPAFLIDYSGNNHIWPQASSPTVDVAGNRQILCVYENTSSNAGDITATCIDINGAYLANANVNVLENDATRLSWPQFRPSVDSDGVRFCVGYHEAYFSGADLDTRVSLVALVGGSLVAQEPGQFLAFSTQPEFNIQVASVYSSSGAINPRYNTTNERATVSPFAIDAYSYDGYAPGGLSNVPSGCGSLTLTPTSGTAIIGQSLSFSINNSPYLGGFLFGYQMSPTPLPMCPSCTIAVNGSSYLGSTFNVTIPANPALVGLPVAIQGFMFAPTGPCLSSIHLSNTVNITIQ